MLLADAITRIKSTTHDISDEYSKQECVDFLNTAIQKIYSIMVGYGYPPVVKEMDLHDDDRLPHNYMRSCGNYPIRITDNIVKLLDDDIDFIRFRYFANPDMLTVDSEALPFDHDAINEIVLRVAVNLALNDNEYDISQDTALLTEVQQSVAAGMGA